MNLGIMAQRLKMSYAFNGIENCFLVNYSAFSEGHVKAKAVGNNAAQNLKLNLPHQLNLNLGMMLVPHHVQLWILRFKNPHF